MTDKEKTLSQLVINAEVNFLLDSLHQIYMSGKAITPLNWRLIELRLQSIRDENNGTQQ